MANETYSFEIAAEVAKARKEIAAFAKETQKQLDGIKSTNAATSFATGFLAVKAAAEATFSAVSGLIQSSVGAALEAEKANIQLANSMRLVGDFTKEAVAQFDDYANALSKTSEASDDEIKASLALAKSFTLTNNEAKRVVTAATELSSITGDSLNSSVEKLAKTFNGTLSKELKQLAPELQGLTKAQLANGDAVDIIANKYRGNAAVINDSFGGALKNLKKSIAEVSEEFGRGFTEDARLKQNITFLTFLTDKLADSLKRINDQGTLNLRVDQQAAQITADVFKRIADSAGDANKAIDSVGNALKENRAQNARLRTASESDIRLSRDRASALEEYNKIREQIESAGLSDVEKINKESADRIKIIRNAINLGAVSDVKKAQKEIAGIEIDRIKKVSEFEKKEAEKTRAEIEKIRAQNEKVATNPFGIAAGKAIRGQQFTEQEAKAAAAGFINTILKGADGARRAVASIIGEIGDKLVPGIGPVVSEIVDILSQGPDKVRETVRGFAKALPEIIKNITEALPVLIEELARELPPALARTMPLVAQSFSVELIKNIPNIVRGFAEGLVEAAKQFVQAILDQVKSVGGLLGGGDSGGGGIGSIPIIGDIASGVSDFVGSLNPFDLTASGQGRERFIPDQSQPLIVNLTVGQSQLARTILDLNRGGFRTS